MILAEGLIFGLTKTDKLLIVGAIYGLVTLFRRQDLNASAEIDSAYDLAFARFRRTIGGCGRAEVAGEVVPVGKLQWTDTYLSWE